MRLEVGSLGVGDVGFGGAGGDEAFTEAEEREFYGLGGADAQRDGEHVGQQRGGDRCEWVRDVGDGPVDWALDADVPEVDAVGEDADAGDEAVGATAAAGGPMVGAVEQEEQGCGGEVDEGNEPGRGEGVGFGEGVAVDVETPEAEGEHEEQRDDLTLQRVEPLRPEGAQRGKGDAEQERVDAGVGIEVDRMAVGQQERAKDFDEHGKEEAGAEQCDGTPAARCEEEDHRGEGEVEVLFDREAPGVSEAGGEVVLNVEQVLPEEAAEGADVDERGDQEEDVVSGPDLEGAALEEAEGVDAAGAMPFLHHEAADEEAAEDEEDVHTGPAEAFDAIEDVRGDEQIVRAVVEDEHQENGDPADEIELDLTPCGTGLRGHRRRIARDVSGLFSVREKARRLESSRPYACVAIWWWVGLGRQA
jgi:hypothetical protein